MEVNSQTGGRGRPDAEGGARRPRRSLGQLAVQRLLGNRLALVGGVVVLAFVVLAVLAPVIAPYDPAKQNYLALNEAPSRAHLFGTDNLGRDIFSRLVYGARTSVSVGVITQLIILGIGLPVGAIAALAGRRTDNLLMRLVDVVYAFPDLLLIILLRSIFGGSIYMIFLAIGLAGWSDMARLVRGQVLSLKEREYVLAAVALGAGGREVLGRHLLPNAIGPVVVAVTFGVPRAIFAEAALSYIGVGVRPPTPSWGTMIQDGTLVISAYPHEVVSPALAIALLMLAFTFLGDGLRDALDPRSARAAR
ncbi:MAG: ABC transporter permease [Chloroflexi bacterium]|nr:ABC transporter permease [Chloroflexota bacterium]